MNVSRERDIEKAVDGPSSPDLEQRDGAVADEHGMKRDLSRRHINMIAIAGLIGTGLFLASGQAIALAGPVGALFGYMLMGLVAYAISVMTGEIAAFLPVTGGFVRHAIKFVQPALGIATGWNFWYTLAIVAPAEFVAAGTLVGYWDQTTNPAVYLTVFMVVAAAINFCGVRLYGESEVFFATLKILLIIGLILAGLIVDLGGSPRGDRIGFRYWLSPGPFNTYLVDSNANTGRFLAFWSTLIPAAYSFANIQFIATAGAETRDPRTIIPAAVNMTFWRILVFYILSLFIVGLLVPSNDPALGIAPGTAQQSPFVIAFTRAGIAVLPSIINAVVCTSAFSAGSACVFLASRTLYGFALDGYAPAVFLATNRFGAPYAAVAASLGFSPLVYLTLGRSASVVFGWFVNVTTISSLLSWGVVCVTFLRFYYGMRAQGIARARLFYRSPWQPYMAWMCLGTLVVVVLTAGYQVFFPGRWSTSAFLTTYINLPIFLGLWVVAAVWTRKGFVGLAEMDLSEILLIDEEKKEREGQTKEMGSWWRRHLI